jgi:hypothetical protein
MDAHDGRARTTADAHNRRTRAQPSVAIESACSIVARTDEGAERPDKPPRQRPAAELLERVGKRKRREVLDPRTVRVRQQPALSEQPLGGVLGCREGADELEALPFALLLLGGGARNGRDGERVAADELARGVEVHEAAEHAKVEPRRSAVVLVLAELIEERVRALVERDGVGEAHPACVEWDARRDQLEVGMLADGLQRRDAAALDERGEG